jgi:Ca-activated chloride channel family protein
MQDPSLLGLVGQEILVARPINIGAKQQKSFRLKYAKPCLLKDNLLDIFLPLDGERFSLGPVGELEIRVRYKMGQPIRNVFSPSHHLSVFRESPYRCVVTVKSDQKRESADFRLLAFLYGDDLSLGLLTHRSLGQTGTFMVFLSPPLAPVTAKEPDKDVVFLLDCSGSMGERHFKMAARAVSFCLERLRGGDRFNVLTVGTRVRRMADRLIPATGENILDAVNFVNSLSQGGGTDLYNALLAALDQFTSRQRPCIVMLAGDGRPTVGITDPDLIAEDVLRNNRMRARVFVLAVGDKPNITLLDKLASVTRGGLVDFSEKESFESIMNRYLSGVSPPRLADMSLSFQGITPAELYPNPIPDLFGQESLAVFGRYSSEGNIQGKARLRARLKGRVQTSTGTFKFPEMDPDHPYLPALWAMRRLAAILEKQASKEPDLPVNKETSELVKRFGFRSPSLSSNALAEPYSEQVTKDSGNILWFLKRSYVSADVESEDYRHVGAKTFRFENRRWVDTRLSPSMPILKLDFLGDQYFALLREDPDLGAYLALGPQVTLVRGSSAISVIADR